MPISVARSAKLSVDRKKEKEPVIGVELIDLDTEPDHFLSVVPKRNAGTLAKSTTFGRPQHFVYVVRSYELRLT